MKFTTMNKDADVMHNASRQEQEDVLPLCKVRRSEQEAGKTKKFSAYSFHFSAFGGLSGALSCRNFSDNRIYLALAMCIGGIKKNFLALAMCIGGIKKNFLVLSMCIGGTKKNFLALLMCIGGIKKNFLALSMCIGGIKKNFLVPLMYIEGLYLCILAFLGQIK